MGHVAHVNESSYTFEFVRRHIYMSQITHMNESEDTHT